MVGGDMTVTVHHLHATENTFLVVDVRGDDALAAALAARATELCADPVVGPVDGLILLGAPAAGSDADCTMRLVNADGTDAEMSGNGIRTLAHVAHGLGLGDGRRLAVDTAAGRRTLDLEVDDAGTLVAATVDMGAVIDDAAAIPTTADPTTGITAEVDGVTYAGDAVGMGNPHWVLVVEDPATARLAEHGPALEHDPRFPNRTNVEFIAPTPGEPDAITMRVWERGVGETRSCGTGACAAAAVAHRRGLVGARVTVHVPGGDLTVDLGPTVRLTGPVVETATHPLEVA
jgi:diaminopimelate epimerase